MNLITNKHCKERRLVGKSGGGEIISFIVLPPLRHTRRTGRPSRIEITQFFWKLFPVDFGFLKFLGNGDVFFWKDCNQKIRVEHAFGRREESRKFQELEGFEAKCSLCAFYLKQWAGFPFRICKEGSRVKRKIWSFVSLGPDWKKQGNWESAWSLVFHLHPAVDQFTCFNIFHPCFGSELFRFTRLTLISSSTFSSNFLRYLCTWRKWK